MGADLFACEKAGTLVMPRHYETYGTVITEDRYSGTYSGGKWLSFPGDFGGDIEADNVFDSDAFGGDVETQEWWHDNLGAQRVGRGVSPAEAYEDMLRRQ